METVVPTTETGVYFSTSLVLLAPALQVPIANTWCSDPFPAGGTIIAEFADDGLPPKGALLICEWLPS